MRLMLCAAALLSLCSISRADRILIQAAIANYVTAEDAVDFEVWLDQPFDSDIHRLRIRGANEATLTNDADGATFAIGNHEFGSVVPIDAFNLWTYDLVNGGDTNRLTYADIDFAVGTGIREGILRNIVAMTIPADLLRFDDMIPDENGESRFLYVVSIRDEIGTADTFMSFSTIDAPGYEDVLTPEPSSLVLLGMAAHLYWLPSWRNRRSKRRARIEADRIDA